MKKVIIATFVGGLALPVLAQMTPVGVWRTYDDNTKELSSEVRITENGGVLSGKIEKLLRKEANEIDSWKSPHKAIVSVLMLKEGWDVRNVTTIVGPGT